MMHDLSVHEHIRQSFTQSYLFEHFWIRYIKKWANGEASTNAEWCKNSYTLEANTDQSCLYNVILALHHTYEFLR